MQVLDVPPTRCLCTRRYHKATPYVREPWLAVRHSYSECTRHHPHNLSFYRAERKRCFKRARELRHECSDEDIGRLLDNDIRLLLKADVAGWIGAGDIDRREKPSIARLLLQIKESRHTDSDTDATLTAAAVEPWDGQSLIWRRRRCTQRSQTSCTTLIWERTVRLKLAASGAVLLGMQTPWPLPVIQTRYGPLRLKVQQPTSPLDRILDRARVAVLSIGYAEYGLLQNMPPEYPV